MFNTTQCSKSDSLLGSLLLGDIFTAAIGEAFGQAAEEAVEQGMDVADLASEYYTDRAKARTNGTVAGCVRGPAPVSYSF